MTIRYGVPDRVGEIVSLDTEFFGVPERRSHLPMTGKFALLTVCTGDTVWVIGNEEDIQPTVDKLKDSLWVMHHALFDLPRLRRYAKLPRVRVLDTMIMAMDKYGGLYDRFSLADLARRELNMRLSKEVRGEFREEKKITSEMIEYAVWDAQVTLQLGYLYNDPYISWYWEIDEPMIWAVMDMRPVLVDTQKWLSIAGSEGVRFDESKAYLPFNARSSEQVKEYFLKEFKVRLPSTREEVLKTTAKRYPSTEGVVNQILALRGAGKNVSTYGENWLRQYVDPDGYVRADWRVVGTETGRMSSADPNLQQVPVRKTPAYREAFVASPGRKMVIIDVNQQEVRINAFFSQDRRLLEMLEAGGDIHLEVTRLLFNDPTIEKSDSRRAIGKAINLGLAYGLSASGLARQVGIEVSDAKRFLEMYYQTFPGVKQMQQTHLLSAANLGYIRTASGRPVWINPYSTTWQNNVMNAPIQGSGGDQIKLASVLLHKKTRELGKEYALCLLVHDEQVLDVPENEVDEYIELAREAWQEASERLFPGVRMEFDIVVGDSWGAKN